MKKTFLFDLDGTLINSFDSNLFLHNLVFKELGEKELTKEDYQKYFHTPGKKMYEEMVPHLDPIKLRDRFRELQKTDANKDRLYEGVIELLTEIKNKNHTMAVVTNKSKVTAKFVMEKLNIIHFFNVSVSSDEVTNPKPHKEHVLCALEKLQISPNESTFMIGDSHADISSGHDAGVTTVLVHTEVWKHFPHKPHHVFKHIKDIRNLL